MFSTDLLQLLVGGTVVQRVELPPLSESVAPVNEFREITAISAACQLFTVTETSKRY